MEAPGESARVGASPLSCRKSARLYGDRAGKGFEGIMCANYVKPEMEDRRPRSVIRGIYWGI